MKVHYGVEGIAPMENAVVTVGSFDGVHVGHRALLDCVRAGAAELGGCGVVVTFSPHPRAVLPDGGDIKVLTTLPEKLSLLNGVGIDQVVVIPFTDEFSRLSPHYFVERIIVGRLGARRLVVGFNHRFGRGKEGDAGYLARMGAGLGFDIMEFRQRDVGGAKVSSTVIRGLVSEGDMRAAAKLLGHPYMAKLRTAGGRVLPPDPDKLLPPAGRYPVVVENKGTRGKDLLVIGDQGTLSLEGILHYGPQAEVTVEF